MPRLRMALRLHHTLRQSLRNPVSACGFLWLTAFGTLNQTYNGLHASGYLEEKGIELPYRGRSERSWRDFDNDDAMILGGSIGLLATALHSRRSGVISGWRPWVGALGFGTSSGYAGRSAYSYASNPSAWHAANERCHARRQEAAKWQIRREPYMGREDLPRHLEVGEGSCKESRQTRSLA